MWAAVDDYWDNDFLQKNLDVLQMDPNIVCSISKINTYDFTDEELDKHDIKTVNYPKFLKNFVKTRRKKLISSSFPISGSYTQKVRLFLKNPGASSRFYGLYRTNQIKECYIKRWEEENTEFVKELDKLENPFDPKVANALANGNVEMTINKNKAMT